MRKRFVILFVFMSLTLDLLATETVYFTFDINRNTAIWTVLNVSHTEPPSFIQNPSGLYWNLLVWSKNAQSKLQGNNDLNAVEVFSIRGTELSSCGKIYRDLIFLTEEKAREFMEKRQKNDSILSIDAIILTHENINNILQ